MRPPRRTLLRYLAVGGKPGDTSKRRIQIPAYEMLFLHLWRNNRPAFPTYCRLVISFTRAHWHVSFFLGVVSTPAAFTEAESFHPVSMFIAWNVPLITAKQTRPFCYAKRDYYKWVVMNSMISWQPERTKHIFTYFNYNDVKYTRFYIIIKSNWDEGFVCQYVSCTISLIWYIKVSLNLP